ncbi:cupin [Vibrio sp. 10N.286.49.C2]|uniref:cupin domain-containing protein n=1 Tax=unclassified Vibrio TaxID=2614977 RepID=UPI000C863B05|nr:MULTISPECIES: cupin domain-containing protein [unclassified Vibrio]PMH34809.1 cupin [Vibrio sp. 10N.286.49.C2]PMH51403.1 cupin [Vibrio sp. 10N.286.49.B1]PMH81810.1 cupin [Vibrio sp. 10N.286.48.B7]
MERGNLFSGIPDVITNELFEDIQNHSNIRIERIVSDGHSSCVDDWYNQDEHEWVSVIQGEGVIEYADGSEITLKAGDYVNIPANTKHRVKSTSNKEKTIWLAVFYQCSTLSSKNQYE